MKVTWSIAAKFWWRLVWRMTIIITPVIYAIGGILGFVMVYLNIPVEQNEIYLKSLGILLSVLLSILVVKIVLKKFIDESIIKEGTHL